MTLSPAPLAAADLTRLADAAGRLADYLSKYWPASGQPPASPLPSNGSLRVSLWAGELVRLLFTTDGRPREPASRHLDIGNAFESVQHALVGKRVIIDEKAPPSWTAGTIRLSFTGGVLGAICSSVHLHGEAQTLGTCPGLPEIDGRDLVALTRGAAELKAALTEQTPPPPPIPSRPERPTVQYCAMATGEIRWEGSVTTRARLREVFVYLLERCGKEVTFNELRRKVYKRDVRNNTIRNDLSGLNQDVLERIAFPFSLTTVATGSENPAVRFDAQ